MWSSPQGRDASFHQIGAKICIQSGVIDVFLEIQDGGAPSWIFKLGKFGTFPHVHSVVLELDPSQIWFK